MAIRIIEEPEIVLTRSQHERLQREYQAEFRHWSSTVAPPSFEDWLRARTQEPSHE